MQKGRSLLCVRSHQPSVNPALASSSDPAAMGTLPLTLSAADLARVQVAVEAAKESGSPAAGFLMHVKVVDVDGELQAEVGWVNNAESEVARLEVSAVTMYCRKSGMLPYWGGCLG